jgi:hypothetical protein
LSVLEFRQLLDVSHSTAHRWLKPKPNDPNAKRVASIKVRGKRLIPFSEFVRLREEAEHVAVALARLACDPNVGRHRALGARRSRVRTAAELHLRHACGRSAWRTDERASTAAIAKVGAARPDGG